MSGHSRDAANRRILRYVVISGFLDIYPGQTVPAHLQNLVSGYATYQDIEMLVEPSQSFFADLLASCDPRLG